MAHHRGLKPEVQAVVSCNRMMIPTIRQRTFVERVEERDTREQDGP